VILLNLHLLELIFIIGRIPGRHIIYIYLLLLYKLSLLFKHILDCFSKILEKEGVGALWNGTGPSLLLVCNPTIQFVVYEALKRKFIQMLKTRDLGTGTLFVATLVTYPVQVIQSRMRVRTKL